MPKLTPLMQQYLRLKKDYKDSVLLFQMGDFYECFYEDAEILAKELGITLTSREKGEGAPPMAGFPIKALDSYLPKLVQRGYKVAIAQQVEDPKLAKGLVERKVVEIVTSGTFTNPEEMDEKEANIILTLAKGKNELAVAFTDILQGKIWFNSFPLGDKDLLDLLGQLSISEVVLASPNLKELVPFNVPVQYLKSPQRSAEEFLREYFKTQDLEALDIRNRAEAQSICNLLTYVEYTKQRLPKDLFELSRWNPYRYMQLDSTTIVNLEIFQNYRDRKAGKTLISVIDNTLTGPGARFLRFSILHPLTDRNKLEERYEQIQYFLDNVDLLNRIRNSLKGAYDIERLQGLLAYGKINPKQLKAISKTLLLIATIIKDIKDLIRAPELAEIVELARIIDDSILDEPNASVSEGNIFREEYHPKIKELRALSLNTEEILEKLLEKEKEVSGIQNLKLKYNKVFGYFFEVPKGQLAKVPEHFIRKQTLVNAERFVTPELKNLEERVLTAQLELIELEKELYLQLIEKLQNYVPFLKKTAEYLAYVDFITTLAYDALKFGYTKPNLLPSDSDIEIELVNSRHPVVEHFVDNFVPNSLRLENGHKFVILTGPNMGGKSTFIRQVALIQLLAQIGSYVPAEQASLKLKDRIFARVGASDDITTGRSTFMVELSEVARILRYATSQSLVILDEVGRGTDTAEGLALAYAISKYLAYKIAPLTIFATHYHELTQLEVEDSPFVNYKVDVLEKDENVYFLHTISRGSADKSYGIYIAKLVNLPEEVIHEAESKLTELLQASFPTIGEKIRERGNRRQKSIVNKGDNGGEEQLVLLPATPENLKKIREFINSLDPNKLTPLEALQILYKLKRMLEEEAVG